jgi:hypothetical protein
MAEIFDESGEVTTPRLNSPLDKAGEFAKYLTALATGALVFSAEILKKEYVLPDLSRHLILSSWGFLGLSALCGLAVLARIPVMMAEKTEDLEDKYLEWPIRGQLLFMLLGIVALGTALSFTLWHSSSSAVDEHQSEEGPKHELQRERFTIISSAPHVVGKAPAHQHTFLLDHDTGRVWDMVCDSEKNVRFRAVEVDGINSEQP